MASPRKAPETEGEALPRRGELSRLTNVLALTLVKGLKQGEAIQQLKRAGFQPKEIAALLGTTPNTVSVTILQAKKTPKKAKGKRGED